MCGIAGFWGSHYVGDRVVAEKMASALYHRGPDDFGCWIDSARGLALAHRRLSVLDLSPAGHQPMVSPCGVYVIVYNGEIYNHSELRDELEREGGAFAWRGHSDTETLLAGLRHWGVEKCLRRLNGMFAFAFWDGAKQQLTLARDRIGEKPLYYGNSRNIFLFGSELKALKAHPAFDAEIDSDSLGAFMRYGYIPAPLSIYKGVYKLPAGMMLSVRMGEWAKADPVPYWSLLDVAYRGLQTPFTGSDVEALQGLETRLSEAVKLQQLSDVPVGAFLSGGIDSSTIVSIMQAQSTRRIHTFTIGFHDPDHNEAAHARSVAKHLGTDHTELYVGPKEVRAVIPQLSTIYDEPFGDSSQIPTFVVSQLARRRVTVCLSGDAGDELFGGYNRYGLACNLLKVPMAVRQILAAGLMALSPAQWDRIYSALQPMLPSSLRMQTPGTKAHKLSQVLTAVSDAEIYQRLVSIWQDPASIVLGYRDHQNSFQAWNKLIDFDTTEHRMMAFDAMTYLPDDILCKIDRAAMSVSLETRVPFLDHRVVEYAWRLPLHMKIRNGQRKWLLRQLLYKYVPKELIERPKMGFSMPIDLWLRGPLREWAESLLSEERLKKAGILSPAPIRQKWVEHLSGQRNWQHQLWNVLMFQAWLENQV